MKAIEYGFSVMCLLCCGFSWIRQCVTVEVKTIEQFIKLYTEILTLDYADEIITSDHYEIHK